MDIHHLKVFLAVFRNRSFSKASVSLGLAQPTISDHIRSLESEMGSRLFDRLGRTIQPTREAEALFPLATELVEKADVLKQEVQRSAREMAGEVALGASTIPGTYLLPARMMRFCSLHPGMSFRVVIGDSKEIVDQVNGHSLLMGVVGARLSTPNLQFIPFVEDELCIVGPPSLMPEGSVGLKDLVKYPLICREEGSGTRREFERYLARHHFSLDNFRVVGFFGSTDAMKQAVRSGDAIAVLSKYAVEEDLAGGILRRIDLSEGEMKRHFYIVTHQKRRLPHAYAELLDFLRKG